MKLQTAVARKYAGETPAQRADHIEIALKYTWDDRNREDRIKVHKIPRIRLRELERIFNKRCGPTLPDDDSGREYLVLALDHIVRFDNPVKCATAWAGARAPWMPEEELRILIEHAMEQPKYWRAGELGRNLRLTEAERRSLRITTIRPYNVDKAGLVRKARSRKRAYDTARRRDAGAVSRAEYEALSMSRAKPWEAEGISRRTWYSRRKQQSEKSATVADLPKSKIVLNSEQRESGQEEQISHSGKNASEPLAADTSSPGSNCTSPHRAETGIGRCPLVQQGYTMTPPSGEAQSLLDAAEPDHADGAAASPGGARSARAPATEGEFATVANVSKSATVSDLAKVATVANLEPQTSKSATVADMAKVPTVGSSRTTVPTSEAPSNRYHGALSLPEADASSEARLLPDPDIPIAIDATRGAHRARPVPDADMIHEKKTGRRRP